MKFVTLVLLALAQLGAAAVSAQAQVQAQESWTVTLTRKQAGELQELKGKPSNTGFALSPDGAWGTRWGASSAKAAGDEALANCRAFLKKGRRDCILYTVNGQVVARPVESTRKVSAVYTPVNGKTAPSVFGRAPVNFSGNAPAAMADAKAMRADPAHASRLKRDPGLEQALMQRSFMNMEKRGFAIWFEKGRGEQHMVGNSGRLQLNFGRWIATPDGLVCMFDGAWASTGKKVGARCLLIETIKNGIVRFAWLNAEYGAPSFRKGQIIAGDARRGAVR